MKNTIISLGILLAHCAAAETVGFVCKVDSPYGAAANNTGLNIGHTFTVTGNTITVTDLGVFDELGDGLLASHDVILFSDPTGAKTPLATVTVPAGTGAPLSNGSRFAALPAPIILPPGQYAVVAYQMNGTANASDPYCEQNGPSGSNRFVGSFNIKGDGNSVFEFTTDGSAYPGDGGGALGLATDHLASASFIYTDSDPTTIAYTADRNRATYGAAANNPPGLNIGHTFVVGGPGIDVYKLGVFDRLDDGDGLNASHDVTLFSDPDGTKTPVPGGSVTVPAGTTGELGDGFRFADLAAPVHLPAGKYAIIVYQLNGNAPISDPYSEDNSSGFNGDPFLSNVAGASSPFQFTADPSPTYPVQGFGGNFAITSFTYAVPPTEPPLVTSDYPSTILADEPLAYYRLGETAGPLATAANAGSLGAGANGTHTVGVKLGAPGALAGDPATAATYTGIADGAADGGSPTTVPFDAALNPAGSFTVESWLMPTANGFGNAQCPWHNRASTLPNGDGNRSSWDTFQRGSAVGWNFRMFNGVGSASYMEVTGGPYTVDQWSHLVAVHDASVPSLTLYLNGVQVAQETVANGTYAAKTVGEFAIGSYSNPSLNPDGYENSFVGSIDEMAIYGTALSGAQVLAHYQNGTNASRSTPYATLVASDSPVEYWKMDEPANNVATNKGTLGSAADGVLADTTLVSGPQSPAFAGFETSNSGQAFDGSSSFVELGNDSGMNISGTGTIEAWVQPEAAQNFAAYILGHGGNSDFAAESGLWVESDQYQVFSFDGTTGHQAQFDAAPDMGAETWVHVVGTYDGSNWNLYRDGVLVASNPDATGFLPVNDANWAIGARGRWTKAFGYNAGTTFPDGGFTGGIDEVAIYNYALTETQVAVHYFVAVVGPNALTIVSSGTDVILTWPKGTLQGADDVTGPWADVVATSPLTTPAGLKKFYRIRIF